MIDWLDIIDKYTTILFGNDYKIMTKHFQWTDPLEYFFLQVILNVKGHMKTSGETLTVKWERILNLLKEKSAFVELAVKQERLRMKFDDIKKKVLKDLGISAENANLSDLPENTSDYVKLVIRLVEEGRSGVSELVRVKSSTYCYITFTLCLNFIELIIPVIAIVTAVATVFTTTRPSKRLNNLILLFSNYYFSFNCTDHIPSQ